MIRRSAVAASVLSFALLAVLLFNPRAQDMPRAALRAVHRSWHILSGDLIDVGGYRLRMERGGKGSPCVVMESGLTFDRKTWASVFPEVTQFTCAFRYDRAGLGESDQGPKPRTSLRIIRELHRVLDVAEIKPPYVLVGHSFGGLNVRLYASYYPDEVAGMVLIDASHEDQYERLAALLPDDQRREFLMREGGGNYEAVDLLASASEVRAAPPLPNIPAVILSSDYMAQNMNNAEIRVRNEIQLSLARLFPNGNHLRVQGCGHFIHTCRPEIVVNTIREVVEAARKSMVE